MSLLELWWNAKIPASVRQSSWRTEYISQQFGKGGMVRSLLQQCPSRLFSYPRVRKLPSRHALETLPTLRMADKPRHVRSDRPSIRPAYCGQVRYYLYNTTAQIQQQVIRPHVQWSRWTRTKWLVRRKQFRKPTISTHSTGPRYRRTSKMRRHADSTPLESTTLVSASSKSVRIMPNSITEAYHDNGSNDVSTGTIQELKMADIRLEAFWKKQLKNQGWSSRAIAQIPYCYATSTLAAYNRLIVKYKLFCDALRKPFPCEESKVLAEFLCNLADSSDRPRSSLRSATAALSALFETVCERNPVIDMNLVRLQSALVKSGTTQFMLKSSVMPVDPFYTLFESCGKNMELPLAKLRLKCIVLLALACMLRPSDIAPKAVVFDSVNLTERKLVMSVGQVVFEENGNLTVKFLGIKNDANRDGFEVTIPPASKACIDPVSALKVYIARTNDVRETKFDKAPLFIQLTKPYEAISAATVTKILNEAINLAGLEGWGYSTKSFMPTGASKSVAAGVLPETIMQIGRWKTKEVFLQIMYIKSCQLNLQTLLFVIISYVAQRYSWV